MEQQETKIAIEAGRAATRSEGYTNAQVAPFPDPFPESQVFGMIPPTLLASGTGSITWTTVDVSALVPMNTEYLWGYFRCRKPTTGTIDGAVEVRRDDQPDSSVYEVVTLFEANGDQYAESSLFVVPVTMAGIRTFDYRLNGTVTSTLEWRFEARGYTTRRRNTADANGLFGNNSGGTLGGDLPGTSGSGTGV